MTNKTYGGYTGKELRELLNAASSGPWFASHPYTDDLDLVTVSIGPFDISDDPDSTHYEDTITEVWGGQHDAKENAELIVALRNSASDMLDHIDKQQSEIKRMKKLLNKMYGKMS